jgi:hypothetical protein
MPIPRAARMILRAISPRLASNRFVMGGISYILKTP